MCCGYIMPSKAGGRTLCNSVIHVRVSQLHGGDVFGFDVSRNRQFKINVNT